jgi:predicted transcriptional regulator of viral defense system
MGKVISLPKNKKFFTIRELLDLGFSYYKINKLVEYGYLIKQNKKLYENVSFIGDDSDFSTVAAYIPNGVFCMMTAARYYGLTTYLPDAIDIAIKRDKKVSTMPSWPKTNVWSFPKDRFDCGIVDVADGSSTIKMYDLEKTVIDILYYRNKIGIEETKQVLKNYLARSDRNLNKLHRYAEQLGCKSILGTYLEVLL